ALLGALRRELEGVAGADVGVTVPVPYLAQVGELLESSSIAWGAQDVSVHPSGAYTGEVAASMLNDFACRYVLVGHSQRRSLHGEPSETVAAKAHAAVASGSTPVVGVRETLAELEAGSTLAVIELQLQPVLALGAGAVAQMVLAYEPV